MHNYTKTFGIDIGKKTFDVVDSSGSYYQFDNNPKGFAAFLQLLDRDSHCVMEATGYYHYRLAYFLNENHIPVSVENPLSIKRFIQMKLMRVKTDKSDARMICHYGQERELSLWRGYSEHQTECLQMLGLLDTYTKQCTALKNKIKAEAVLGNPSELVVRSLNRSLRTLQLEITEIEEALMQLVELEYRDIVRSLRSIPGIGPKTATMLVVVTDGFKRFERGAQLCSFCGLTPVIRQSGSSVKGKARISKVGNAKLRNLLFLCSFTASKNNKACKELYDRLIARGKSKKLALIAVSNKLLKQAFAISKSGIEYTESYQNNLAFSHSWQK